jgi:hypothetical protein
MHPRRKHPEINAIAGFEDRAIGVKKNLIAARSCLQRNLAAGSVSTMIVGVNVQELDSVGRIDFEDSNAG